MSLNYQLDKIKSKIKQIRTKTDDKSDIDTYAISYYESYHKRIYNDLKETKIKIIKLLLLIIVPPVILLILKLFLSWKIIGYIITSIMILLGCFLLGAFILFGYEDLKFFKKDYDNYKLELKNIEEKIKSKKTNHS